MNVAIRSAAPAGLALVLLVLSPAAFAQFPAVDPMDAKSCDVKNGWMTVYSQAMRGWDKATKDGRLKEPLTSDIAVWLVAQQNRVIETNDTKGVCLDAIAMRKKHDF